MYIFNKIENEFGLFFENSNITVFFGNKILTQELLIKKFPNTKFNLLQQKHSTIISQNNENLDTSDGHIWSDQKNSYVIMTADCVPLVVYNHTQNILCSLHCGRVGLVNGILNNFLKISNTTDYHSFFIGPHIKTYEIKNDILDKLEPLHMRNISFQKDRIYLDLEKMIDTFIFENFLNFKIYKTNIDTFTDDAFWSYRKNSLTRNRNLSGGLWM